MGVCDVMEAPKSHELKVNSSRGTSLRNTSKLVFVMGAAEHVPLSSLSTDPVRNYVIQKLSILEQIDER